MIKPIASILDLMISPSSAALKFLALIFGLFVQLGSLPAAEPTSVPPAVGETNAQAQDALRTYLQLQEQLHATQLSIERNRKEGELMANETARLLSDRLQAIEQALAGQKQALEAQRSKDLETMQSSNRVMLTVAGTFAGVAFLAMAIMVYFQWKAMDRISEFAPLVASRLFPPGGSLESGEQRLMGMGTAEQSGLRLLGAMEQLEKRMYELEHNTRPALDDKSGGMTKVNGYSEVGTNGNATGTGSVLAQGQSLMDAKDAAGALACFEQALQHEPRSTEALIKKGTALERLGRLDEAITCYDQTIATDASLTIAYLHKAGVLNKMERYNEALKCYELALQTQEKRARA